MTRDVSEYLVNISVPLTNKSMSLVLMEIENWTYLTGHDYRKHFGFDFCHSFDHQYPNRLIPNQRHGHQMTLGLGQTSMENFENYEFESRLSLYSF